MPPKFPANRDISAVLNRIADLLEARAENPFRVRSYRNAAATVATVRQSLATLVRQRGAAGLSGLKGVGEKLAGLIEEYVKKGKVSLLQDLEKEAPKEKLEDLAEQKAKQPALKPLSLPVGTILEMDEEYRKRAAAGKLKMIAPRHLNPEKKKWLPIMIREHKGYKFTVMFSNTATAHKLRKTNDWVVVYYAKGKRENQCTVVTESRGDLKGKRVIRGREAECKKFYAR